MKKHHNVEPTSQASTKGDFEREIELPCDLAFGTPSIEALEVGDRAEHLGERRLDIHDRDHERIRLASDRVRARCNVGANSARFQEGNLVWLYNPQRKKGKSPKLMPSWEGPYKVIKRINDVVYRIQRSPKSKMKVVHLDRLTAFQGSVPDRDDQD